MSGTTVYLSRAEQSRWRDRVTSVGTDDEKREHICPLEKYVRRLTGEIVAKISRFISAGLSGLVGETRLRQLCLTPKTGTYLSFRGICSPFTGEIVVKISRVYLSRAERSRWRDKVKSVCLTPKNGNISVL